MHSFKSQCYENLGSCEAMLHKNDVAVDLGFTC